MFADVQELHGTRKVDTVLRFMVIFMTNVHCILPALQNFTHVYTHSQPLNILHISKNVGFLEV